MILEDLDPHYRSMSANRLSSQFGHERSCALHTGHSIPAKGPSEVRLVEQTDQSSPRPPLRIATPNAQKSKLAAPQLSDPPAWIQDAVAVLASVQPFGVPPMTGAVPSPA